MTAFVPKSNSPEKDLVMTPDWLAADILNHFPIKGSFLDPSRGSGAFYNQVNSETKDWCEISEGRDFMKYKGRADWIVTNPPWSKMRDFLVKGMEVAENVVYLTTINHYTTKRRMLDIEQMGFGVKEIFCVPTPSKPWPALGFQLAAVHIQKNYKGKILLTWHKDALIKGENKSEQT
jgi:hypothetical protein